MSSNTGNQCLRRMATKPNLSVNDSFGPQTVTRISSAPARKIGLRAMLLASLLVPSLAMAQGGEAEPLLRNAVSGPYIGLGAGMLFSQRSIIRPDTAFGNAINGVGAIAHGNATFQPGFSGVASFGWGFGGGFRAEIEGSYRSEVLNRFGGFSGLGPYTSSGGRRDTYGLMGNLFLDLGTFGPVVPYIGLGAGYMVSDWSNIRGTGPAYRLVVDGNDGRFAYQGIAGFSFPLDFAPGFSLQAEYRFLGTVAPNQSARLETSAGSALIASGRVETETYQHSLMLGLRYAFGQSARRATPPAATPAPARSFLVFFDFDRADLNERARQLVAQAAEASRSQETTRIEVAGHADRSGAPQYNQALSQRRAESVAAELVRRGVARTDITITAYGESQPLVPTADGTREPQNRRVEIVLR